jgi:hypothetical protein
MLLTRFLLYQLYLLRCLHLTPQTLIPRPKEKVFLMYSLLNYTLYKIIFYSLLTLGFHLWNQLPYKT